MRLAARMRQTNVKNVDLLLRRFGLSLCYPDVSLPSSIKDGKP